LIRLVQNSVLKTLFISLPVNGIRRPEWAQKQRSLIHTFAVCSKVPVICHFTAAAVTTAGVAVGTANLVATVLGLDERLPTSGTVTEPSTGHTIDEPMTDPMSHILQRVRGRIAGDSSLFLEPGGSVVMLVKHLYRRVGNRN
jgi:hypothetical protein